MKTKICCPHQGWRTLVCWLDNFIHARGGDWERLCNYHDRMITRSFPVRSEDDMI